MPAPAHIPRSCRASERRSRRRSRKNCPASISTNWHTAMPTATAVMPIGAVNHAIAPVQTIMAKLKVASAPGRPTAKSGPSMPARRIVQTPATASTCAGTTAPAPVGAEDPRHDVGREHDEEREQREDQRGVDPQEPRSHLAQILHALRAGQHRLRDAVGDVADLELVFDAELVRPPVEPDLLCAHAPAKHEEGDVLAAGSRSGPRPPPALRT